MQGRVKKGGERGSPRGDGGRKCSDNARRGGLPPFAALISLSEGVPSRKSPASSLFAFRWRLYFIVRNSCISKLSPDIDSFNAQGCWAEMERGKTVKTGQTMVVLLAGGRGPPGRDTVARDEIGEKEPCAKERELRRIPVNGEG